VVFNTPVAPSRRFDDGDDDDDDGDDDAALPSPPLDHGLNKAATRCA